MGSASCSFPYPPLNQNSEQRVEVEGHFHAKKGVWVSVPSLWMGMVISLQGRWWPRGRRGAWGSAGSGSSEAWRGSLAALQTELPGEQWGNCTSSGRICIFLITRIHCKTDDNAGLVLSFCLFLPLNIAEWSAINGHALNCLAQHVQHWEQETIVSGPLLKKTCWSVSGQSENLVLGD